MKQVKKVRARRQDRAEYLDGHGDSKYARKQTGYGATHARHDPRVLACPYCRPTARSLEVA